MNYLKVGKTIVRETLYDYAKGVSNWSVENSTFYSTQVPYSLWKDCPLIDKYLELCNVIIKPTHGFIFYMPENSFYRPHVDGKRWCTLNILLNDVCDSTTFFETNAINEWNTHIDILDYEKDYAYLLDTQKTHSVLNGNQKRYVFSLAYPDIPFYLMEYKYKKNKKNT